MNIGNLKPTRLPGFLVLHVIMLSQSGDQHARLSIADSSGYSCLMKLFFKAQQNCDA